MREVRGKNFEAFYGEASNGGVGDVILMIFQRLPSEFYN